MSGAEDTAGPVKTRAFLIDPHSMRVLWLNEAAAEGLAGRPSESEGHTVDDAVPMAEAHAVPEMVRSVADSGTPRHWRTELISMGKGSMGLSSSLYRLPDGTVLLLMENAWRSGERDTKKPSSRRG